MLRLLLDEDIKSHQLVRLLKEAGHDVCTTTDFGVDGASDAEVLDRATSEGRIVLTYNCDDFRALHQVDQKHAGVLVVYQEPGKALSRHDIVRAISNIETAGISLPGGLYALNQWSY